MLYCSKCARILDEDMERCPYCDAVDAADNDVQPEDLWGMNTDVVEPDILLAKPDSNIEEIPPDVLSEIPTEPFKETEFKETEFKETVNETLKEISTENFIKTPSGTQPSEPTVITPLPNVQRARMYGNPSRNACAAKPEPFLSNGAKILITVGCAIIPIIGVIAAILFMTRREEVFRKFGLLLLIIILAEMALICGCCAIAGFAGYA